MWIIFKFYNITIESVNVDKGGGETLIHKMWIKIRVLFFLPLPNKKLCPAVHKFLFGWCWVLGRLPEALYKNFKKVKMNVHKIYET